MQYKINGMSFEYSPGMIIKDFVEENESYYKSKFYEKYPELDLIADNVDEYYDRYIVENTEEIIEKMLELYRLVLESNV